MADEAINTLVVGISSTALFNLADVDQRFREAEQLNRDEAIKSYRDEMRKLETEPLEPGAGYAVVDALLRLNKHQKEGESPLVEVVVMSRNSPETGLRVLNSIRSRGLKIRRSAFTGGEPVAGLLQPFRVDLFLSTSASDVQQAIDHKACAAAILSGSYSKPAVDDDRVRIAFDGDAVLFNEDSELLYRRTGNLEKFLSAEQAAEDTPLGDGPYANLLRKLAKLQERLPTRVEYSPVRIMIVTARNAPADIRVIKTLRAWGVYVDEAYFLGDIKKADVLEALKPHIFFDDQERHIRDASRVVPSGRVPYSSGSELRALESRPDTFVTTGDELPTGMVRGEPGPKGDP